MEEQRQRQEEESRRASAKSAADAGITTSAADGQYLQHTGCLKCVIYPKIT